MSRILICLFLITFISCKENTDRPTAAEPTVAEVKEDIAPTPVATQPDLQSLPDTSFVRLADYSRDFVYDMKYATTDNFLEKQVYECDECYTRVNTAKALIAVNKAFMEKGYRIKFYDCYRPHSVQKKMWEIYPNPIYVADPAKGSIHNKGGAVDITLVDMEDNELNMGTPFDFFGKKAHHAFGDLPEDVLNNRKVLKETMEAYGFNAITSEWWHYNYGPTLNYEVADFVWHCE
ncbi:peptidase M15 [Robertkochia marina]|uniref:D-alanyl-D-alanine dipeptidase n=1 Tax=Robertkochia marina TaxID=1227945 RepID=A0A4S3M1A0_9FLAO|nr:M15 family metallopeptidase [Robertkochia marina]THD66743.1 peptidase M15 [Robertkochia marina]TRZ42367.1 peptidase M15 [Robertkochia marina]